MALKARFSQFPPDRQRVLARSVQIAVFFQPAAEAVAQLPALSIRKSGSDVQLAWPASAAGWELQSTPDLSAAGSRQKASGSAVAQGANLTWTNTFPPGTCFFRVAQTRPLLVPANALTGTVATVGTLWLVTWQ